MLNIALGTGLCMPLVSCSEHGEGVIRDEKVITSDEHWERDVLVQGVVKVQNGATLTIAEGVTVAFADGAKLVVGNDGNATIKIMGSARRPVRISGGDGIYLLNTSTTSGISHCTISGAGLSGGNALSINRLNFHISHLMVVKGGAVEIKEHVYEGAIDGLTVDCNASAALSVPADYRGFIQRLDVGGKMIHLRSGGNSPSLELESGASYLVTARIELEGDLNFDQVNIQFTSGAGLLIGTRYGATMARLIGSTFSSHDRKQWRGIVFGSQVLPKSRMEGCTVSDAEIGLSLMSDQPFTVRNCKFPNNKIPIKLIRGSGWNTQTIADNNVVPGGEGGISLTSNRQPEDSVRRSAR